jgi:hypothetical protein
VKANKPRKKSPGWRASLAANPYLFVRCLLACWFRAALDADADRQLTENKWKYKPADKHERRRVRRLLKAADTTMPPPFTAKQADLVFLQDGRVRSVRNSRSLQHDWKSQTKGLGALKEPTKNDGTLSEPVLEPVVFDLATLPENTNPDAIWRALEQIVLASDNDSKLLIKGFVAKIKAARRIRGTSKEALPQNKPFVASILELARELKRLPHQVEVSRKLKINKAEVSRLCKETGFNLPSAKPGRRPR